MAASDFNRLHLVTPASPKPKPQRIESGDIASEMMAVVREVTATLALYPKQHDTLMGLVYSTLEARECAALRAKAAQRTKAGE